MLGNLIADMVVEMIAPGFEPNLSTLDVRVTIEEGEIDVRGHHIKLTRLSGNQQLQYPYLVEQLYADEKIACIPAAGLESGLFIRIKA